MSREGLETRSGGAIPSTSLCKSLEEHGRFLQRRTVQPSSSGYVSVFKQDRYFSAGVARGRLSFRIRPRFEIRRGFNVLSSADSQITCNYQTQPREDNTEIPESYAQNIRWSFLIDGRDVGTDVSYVSARSVGK